MRKRKFLGATGDAAQQPVPEPIEPVAPPGVADPEAPADTRRSPAAVPFVPDSDGFSAANTVDTPEIETPTEGVPEVEEQLLLVPPLEFGPEARLRPEPNAVTPQSVRPEDYVSDTELDGGRVGANEIRAVSARGHVHRWEGEVRQDAFAFGLSGNRLVLAVSDGVGNAVASSVGANAAVREATREVLEEQTVVSRARQAVQDAAVTRGLSPRDVSATLVAASIPIEPTRGDDESLWPVTIYQLGDSVAVRLRGGAWDVLHHPDARQSGSDDLTNSAVDALPHSGEAAVWIEHFEPDDVLLLVTDGVSNLAAANSEYKRAIISLFDGRTPSMAELLRVVDATVKSFDDDRTVVALRFLESGG